MRSAGSDSFLCFGADQLGRLLVRVVGALDEVGLFSVVFVSMGMEREAEQRRRDFTGFTLDAARMALAKPDCMVLHCLPAHRVEEISTAVFEAHADEIFTEAENRLHVQKAVLAVLLAGK